MGARPFAIPLIIATTLLFIVSGVVRGTHLPLTTVLHSSFVNSQEPLKVQFCDLIKHSEKYENKLVRVRASFVVNFESSMLYDSGCNDKGPQVEFMLDCPSDAICKEMKEILAKDLKGDPLSGMRTDLVLLGRLTRSKVLSGKSQEASVAFRVSKIEETIPPAPEKSIQVN